MEKSLLKMIMLLAFTTVFCGVFVKAHEEEPARKRLSPLATRGKYLVTILGCNDCHTPKDETGRLKMHDLLAGYHKGEPIPRASGGNMIVVNLSLTAWAGSWGISFASNITPDDNTGIGRWTEEDFIKAMRTGVTPRGRVMLPPMPWVNYSNMSETDLKAIFAYLQSIEPIYNKVPKNIVSQEPEAVKREEIPKEEKIPIEKLVSNYLLYLGSDVFVEGTARNIQRELSLDGEPITYFRLFDQKGNFVNVSSQGSPDVSENEIVKVKGKFSVVVGLRGLSREIVARRIETTHGIR